MKKYFITIFPALLSVILFVITVFWFILPKMHDSILSQKRTTIIELAQTVKSILATYERQERNGLLTRQQAKSRAIARIKELRYGSETKDYFWISDFVPTLILHPYLPELEGLDLSDYKDIKGKRVFVEFANLVKKDGEGFSKYYWQWKDDATRIEEKESYLVEFKPWGWIVGAGHYIGDIKREMKAMTQKLTVLSIAVLIVISLIAFYITMHSLNVERQREEAVSALKESNEKFKSISINALDGIVMIDSRGKINFWNRAAEQIFGYVSEEIMHKDLHNLLVSDEHNRAYRNSMQEFARTGDGAAIGKNFQLSAIKKDGTEIPVEISISALQLAGEWCAVGIVRDLTLRKQAEMEKARLQKQLQQSQKMEAIGTLAGGIAHDFNNLLTVIIGFSQVALRKAAKGEVPLGDLEHILQAGRRAGNLVHQILTFSRQTTSQKGPLSIVPIIKESLKFMRSTLPSNIEIVNQITLKSAGIVGNGNQIHQVLMNLVTNAAHAMKEKGGKLTVGLTDTDGSDDTLLLPPNLPKGQYYCLTVSDTGCGMPPEILENIFDPFYTTKELGEGTGLGLSVVHGILSEHNGDITVESREGEGSTFYVFLPKFIGKSVEKLAIDEDQLTGKGRILVVDDQESVLEAGCAILNSLGYETVPANVPQQAISLFYSNQEKFDMVVMDYDMPQMNGVDLAKKLLEVRPGIPILLVSGSKHQLDLVTMANEAGIRDVFYKPLIMPQFAEKIKEVLNS